MTRYDDAHGAPDDGTGELTSELQRRADHLHPAPLGFDEVQGRAHDLRRRRRVTTGLVAAVAVAAVVVPTALVANRAGRTDDQIPATSSPSVSATASPSEATDSAPTTPSSTPVQGPEPHALDVRDLPTGAPPGIGYLIDESHTTLAFAETGEASVQVTSAGVEVTVDGQGFGYSSSSGLARNAAGTIVAWATDDGQVMAWQDGHPEPLTLGSTSLVSLQVSSVTGDDCRAGGDCRVWLRAYDSSTDEQVSVTMSADGAATPVDRLVQVRDALDDGRILGSTEIGDGTSCSAAFDGSATLMETCDYQLDAFSPDGSALLASEPYHSGIGSGVIAVFSDSGERQSYRIRTSDDLAMYRQAVWEDQTHLLFTAYQEGQWSIVRMGVDGALEYAVAPVAGDAEECPFVLETL